MDVMRRTQVPVAAALLLLAVCMSGCKTPSAAQATGSSTGSGAKSSVDLTLLPLRPCAIYDDDTWADVLGSEVVSYNSPPDGGDYNRTCHITLESGQTLSWALQNQGTGCADYLADPRWKRIDASYDGCYISGDVDADIGRVSAHGGTSALNIYAVAIKGSIDDDEDLVRRLLDAVAPLLVKSSPAPSPTGSPTPTAGSAFGPTAPPTPVASPGTHPVPRDFVGEWTGHQRTGSVESTGYAQLSFGAGPCDSGSSKEAADAGMCTLYVTYEVAGIDDATASAVVTDVLVLGGDEGEEVAYDPAQFDAAEVGSVERWTLSGNGFFTVLEPSGWTFDMCSPSAPEGQCG